LSIALKKDIENTFNQYMNLLQTQQAELIMNRRNSKNAKQKMSFRDKKTDKGLKKVLICYIINKRNIYNH